MFGVARDDVWAAARMGRLYHFDGGSWDEVASGVSSTLFSLWGASRDEMFAVGSNGLLIAYDGDGWSPTRLGLDERGATTGESLQDLWGWATTRDRRHARLLYRHRRDWVARRLRAPRAAARPVFRRRRRRLRRQRRTLLRYDGVT